MHVYNSALIDSQIVKTLNTEYIDVLEVTIA